MAHSAVCNIFWNMAGTIIDIPQDLQHRHGLLPHHIRVLATAGILSM